MPDWQNATDDSNDASLAANAIQGEIIGSPGNSGEQSQDSAGNGMMGVEATESASAAPALAQCRDRADGLSRRMSLRLERRAIAGCWRLRKSQKRKIIDGAMEVFEDTSLNTGHRLAAAKLIMEANRQNLMAAQILAGIQKPTASRPAPTVNVAVINQQNPADGAALAAAARIVRRQQALPDDSADSTS